MDQDNPFDVSGAVGGVINDGGEPAPVVAPEPPQTEPVDEEKDKESFFNVLTSEFGADDDVEELKLDSFYKDLKATHIRDLPIPAKHIIHNMRRAYRLEQQKHQASIEAARQEQAAKDAAIALREKEIMRRQQEFAALVQDPRVVAAAKAPEGELPDPYTEEGIQARIQQGVAQAMQGFLTPFQQAAVETQRQATWLEFVEQNPDMKDKGFQKEVISIIKERQAQGQQISTQDAYRLNRLRRLEAESQQRKASEQAARADSARRVARSTQPGGNPGSTDIPKEIRGNAQKVAAWLKDHPEAWRSIDARR
jgi:hypothetical protein